MVSMNSGKATSTQSIAPPNVAPSIQRVLALMGSVVVSSTFVLRTVAAEKRFFR
jgi:hypothetical protein